MRVARQLAYWRQCVRDWVAYQLRQVHRITNQIEEGFGDHKAPRQLLLGLLLHNLLHLSLQILHIVVVVPKDVAAGGLQALANRVVDQLVGDDDVAALAEGRYDTGNSREGLRVDNASLGTETGRNVGLGLHVYILGTVELGRAAGAYAVGPESLDGLLFDLLVRIEVVKVVRGQVGDRLAGRELCLGARRSAGGDTALAMAASSRRDGGCQGLLPNKHWQLLGLSLLKRSQWRNQGLGLPLPDQLVDLLLA